MHTKSTSFLARFLGYLEDFQKHPSWVSGRQLHPISQKGLFCNANGTFEDGYICSKKKEAWRLRTLTNILHSLDIY